MCLSGQPALKVRLAASSKRDGNEWAWLRPRTCAERRSMPLQTRALVFSIGQFHFKTDGKLIGLEFSYNIEVLHLFSYILVYLTTHPAPASAPQPSPMDSRAAPSKAGVRSAERHRITSPTGRFPPRVVARTSASSPRQTASTLSQMRASPLRRRRVGRGVDWEGGEDERGWLNGDERAPRCH